MKLTVVPKLVIWDLDGTIIDSYGIFAEVMKEAARLGDRPIPEDSVLHKNFHGTLDDAIKGAFDLVENEAFGQLLNDFLRIQDAYYAQPEKHIFSDVLVLMERFKRTATTQIVVTNRAHEGRGRGSPHYIIENSFLKTYISQTVCGDDVTAHKPAAEVLINVDLVHSTNGEDILVIGDQFVDAQLAQNIGSAVVLANRGSDPIPHLEQLATQPQIVESLDEVQLP